MNKNGYEILWTVSAEQDLISIIEYIALDSHAKASDILSRIENTVSKVPHFPKKGRVIPELSKFHINSYREIIKDRWRIIYKISDKTIYILCILDSRRNIEDVLVKRLGVY